MLFACLFLLPHVECSFSRERILHFYRQLKVVPVMKVSAGNELMKAKVFRIPFTLVFLSFVIDGAQCAIGLQR